MSKNRFFFHLLALVIVAVWGITFVSTKKLIGAGLHPAAIFAIRFVMAYAGIWGLTLTEKKPVKIWSDSLKDECIFVFLGITGGSFYFLTENTALAHTQATNVSFLVCVAPLLTALLTLACKRFFNGRFADGLEDIRVGFPLVFGTLLALSGMAMVIFDGTRLQVSPKGDLLALGAALCWALYSLFMSQMTEHYGAVFATRKVFFYGLLTILPFLGRTGGSFSPAVLGQPVVYGNLLFLGLIASLACFIGWNLVMAKLGNVTSTNYVYLNPIFTLITAMVLLGERMTLISGVGCAAILAGVVIAGLKPWRAYKRVASFRLPSGSNGRSKRVSGSEEYH
jgi:drug/metabolite transporter (DMT)-like permease